MARIRKPHEVERDRNYVTEYYLKGYSTRAIAKQIIQRVANEYPDALYTITHKTVSFDIKHLLKQWFEDRIHDINNQKLIELTKIDRLEQTYWEAWEKSVDNHKKMIKKAKGATGSAKPDYQEVTEMEIREFGEPRYLQGIERCIDKRCKLLGLDAPIKMEQQDNSFVTFLMTTE